MNTTKEKIKNVVLVVLVAGMIYLTYSVWFFDSPIGDMISETLFGNTDENYFIQESGGGDIGQYGISPLGIFIRDEISARGVVCNSAQCDDIYMILRGHISKMLNTVSETETISEAEWQNVLRSEGILLDYRGNVPIEALRLWVGAKPGDAAISGRFYFVLTANEKAELYVKNSSSDTLQRIKTEESSEAIKASLATIEASTAFLAVENEAYKSIMPETIIAENKAKPPVLEAYNAMSVPGVKNSVLDAFRLLDGAPSTYYEQDGTEVHVADMVTLKISQNGIVAYSDPRGFADETLGIEVESENNELFFAEKIETARKLCAKIASAIPGDGGIYLMEVISKDEEIEVVFGRHVQGVPVDMHESVYFARIIIKDKIVSAARINLRSYNPTVQEADVISEKLAAAALEGNGRKGEINLRYEDSGAESVSPAWFVGGTKKKSEEAE